MPRKAAKKASSEQDESRAQHDRDYPMCARLSHVRSDKAILTAFLEWLEEKNISLCMWPEENMGPYRAVVDPNKLLMEYFGIDEAELEQERRRILAAQRRANEG